MTEDLRHSCFAGEEFRPEGLPRNTSGWVQLGAYGAVIVWEEDGLERVAQWSNSAGLHIYTEGMHRSCLRIVCPWRKAKAIVETIKRGNMEARMKKTDEIVDQLVKSAQSGFAVVVRGPYGCGKVWMCDLAIKKMGLKARTISLDQLDEMDTRNLINVGPDTGIILDGLQNVLHDNMPILAGVLLQFVLDSKFKRVVFITVPPDTERCDMSARIHEWLSMVTGGHDKRQALTVEVSK
jgi:hypothetical protein